MKTTKKILLTIIAIITILGAFGCGNRTADPVAPDTVDLAIANNGTESSNREVLGVYRVTYDPRSNTLVYAEDRNAETHYNITSLKKLDIKFTSWWFQPELDRTIFECKITNSTKITGYDVRVIFVPNPFGPTYLMNPDDYTYWFNSYEGLTNAFMAYGKNNPDRAFYPFSSDTRQFWVYHEEDDPWAPVDWELIVTASFPGNCPDPYEISGQYCGPISSSMPNMFVTSIFDHGTGPMRAYVETYALTGDITMLDNWGGNCWGAVIYNTNNAAPGTYRCRIVADNYYGSDHDNQDEMLVDYIDITVVP